MLTADHPNAVWMRDVYMGGENITNDKTLSEEERKQRFTEHLAKVRKRMSPDLIIHTGGFRLGAALQGEFATKYSKRRETLVHITPIALEQFLADDYYGINYGKFRLTQRAGGSAVWERNGLGVWRFDNGAAVEHWETPDGPRFDAFFQAADPTFKGTAEEFWAKGV